MKEEKNDENVSKYGEFVCSQFAWLPLDKQKEKTNKMNEMTKNKKKK